MLNLEILSILACPVCKGNLDWLRGKNLLICVKCEKEYIIGTNDVPILIPDREAYEEKYGWKYKQKEG